MTGERSLAGPLRLGGFGRSSPPCFEPGSADLVMAELFDAGSRALRLHNDVYAFAKQV